MRVIRCIVNVLKIRVDNVCSQIVCRELVIVCEMLMLKSMVVLVLFVGVGQEVLQTLKFISRKSEERKG